MKIDKINDEFIVNCTNNSKEERQQVYKFLVDNRNYSRYYLTNNYPIIVCNKKEMNSNHYNTVDTQKAFPNYPIYTFEQFKKYVLKNNNMENKKIIGYKLIKPEYRKAAENIVALGVNWKVGKSFIEVMENNPDDYYTKKLKEAGVLELWFEKIYEEEFKIGDWIISTNDIKSIVFKIESINEEYYECENDNFGIVALRKDKEDLRLATTEEIAKAQKTIVKMYSSNKGEFEIEIIDGKAYYRPENKHLPKEFIRDIINSFDEIIICSNKKENPYNVTIASLNVGCYHNCKKEDWEKVYKLLK